MASRFDDVTVTGTLRCASDAISAQDRDSILRQTDNAVFPVPWTDFRVWDAFQTNLPGTAATDDLALIGGTFATAPPMIQAGDLKAAGATTRYARVQVRLPECYVAGETVSLVLTAGMITTIADTTCTVDVQAYRAGKDGTIGSDLCATASQSINDLTFAAKTFSITPSTLGPGDWLDVRIAIACNDGATATAVTPAIGGVDLVCDIKG